MREPSEEVKRVEQRYEKALDDMEKHYKDVLEQIRDEIKHIGEDNGNHHPHYYYARRDALDIIDKYR